MNCSQKGLTILEMVIASSLVVLLIGVIAFQFKSENRQAEQVIARLQMAKAGVLRYNLNHPQSTDKLVNLVRPDEVNPDNWNGPYVDTATRLTPEPQQCESVLVGTQCSMTIIKWKVVSYSSIYKCYGDGVYVGYDCEPVYEEQCMGIYERVCK